MKSKSIAVERPSLLLNFAFFFTLAFSISGAIGELFSKIYPHMGAELIADLKDPSVSFNFVLALLVAPIFETSILVYCICLAKQIYKNQKIALVCAALPISLLHAPDCWQLPIIVFPIFYIQATAYNKLRAHYERYCCMLFVILMHALHNSIALYVNRDLLQG